MQLILYKMLCMAPFQMFMIKLLDNHMASGTLSQQTLFSVYLTLLLDELSTVPLNSIDISLLKSGFISLQPV